MYIIMWIKISYKYNNSMAYLSTVSAILLWYAHIQNDVI